MSHWCVGQKINLLALLTDQKTPALLRHFAQINSVLGPIIVPNSISQERATLSVRDYLPGNPPPLR